MDLFHFKIFLIRNDPSNDGIHDGIPISVNFSFDSISIDPAMFLELVPRFNIQINELIMVSKFEAKKKKMTKFSFVKNISMSEPFLNSGFWLYCIVNNDIYKIQYVSNLTIVMTKCFPNNCNMIIRNSLGRNITVASESRRGIVAERIATYS